MKPTRIIQFQPGTEFEDTGWHIPFNPTGTDTTLCGLALEGMCSTPIGKPVREAYRAKEGRPTCKHCVAILNYCAELMAR